MTTAVGAQGNVIGFKMLLHRRRMTINRLAKLASVGRSHLSQVLHRVEGRGGQTRRKVAPLLTTEELVALGWDHHGNVSTGTGGTPALPAPLPGTSRTRRKDEHEDDFRISEGASPKPTLRADGLTSEECDSTRHVLRGTHRRPTKQPTGAEQSRRSFRTGTVPNGKTERGEIVKGSQSKPAGTPALPGRTTNGMTILDLEKQNINQ